MPQSSNDDRLWSLVVTDQQRITALDAVTVAIKGWVVTLTSAFVGIAVSSNRRTLVLVALATTAFFAALDLHYRAVQLAHAARSAEVERRMVQEFEFARYQSRSGTGLIGRILKGRYLATFMFYSTLVVVLLLVWLAFEHIG